MESLFQDGLLLQVTGITPGRAASLIAGAAGLISVIIGRLASTGAARRNGSARVRAIVALVLGLAGVLLSIIQLARTSSAAIGTGSGKLGAVVALVLALIGIVLGARAMARLRSVTNTGEGT